MTDTKGREILEGDQIVYAVRSGSHNHGPSLEFGTVAEVTEHSVRLGGHLDTPTTFALVGEHRFLILRRISGARI